MCGADEREPIQVAQEIRQELVRLCNRCWSS
jgi:hypothetical protein